MRPNITEPRLATACLGACLAAIAIATAAEAPVPYPEGFRSWMVVKSLVVGPAHESFPNRGGLHHYHSKNPKTKGTPFNYATFRTVAHAVRLISGLSIRLKMMEIDKQTDPHGVPGINWGRLLS